MSLVNDSIKNDKDISKEAFKKTKTIKKNINFLDIDNNNQNNLVIFL